MSKVHFPRNLSAYTKAQANGNIMMLLALPTVCGQRPNQRPNVDITTTPADVDCAKCRAALPEPTIEEQMRAAHAAGDLAEVVRLSKLV